MKTDITEKGLESLIVQSLVNEAGYVQGDPQDYDREHAVDLANLLEHDAALQHVMIDLLADHTELFKQFSDNPSFKKWLGDTIFGVTYESTIQIGAEQKR